MLLGPVTLAGLWLMAAAGPADVVYLNQLGIKIPLDIRSADRQHIKELHLYSSTNEGKTWEQQSVIPADQDSFKFYAPRDGLYWFAIDVVDHEGKHNPPDMYKARPSQKIVIDTLRPSVRIVSVERKEDEVVVHWEIQEDNPDLSSLHMEYRLAGSAGEGWTPVTVEPRLIGHARFRPTGSGAVSVRMYFKDLAKNEAFAEKEVSTAEVATASLNTPRSNSDTIVPVKGTSLAEPAGNKNPIGGEEPSREPSALKEPPAKPRDEGLTLGSGQSGSAGDTGPNSGASSRVVASSDKTSTETASGLADSHPRRGALPPLQVVKSPQVTLEYQLKEVGPSGIGKVELWLTRDEGQTWSRYAEDPETKSQSPQGKLQRTVELPGEGLFGLTLVVRSRAGLGKPPPKPGDVPQMRIEVDTTAPMAELFNPVPHPHRHDTLVLSWKAYDINHPSLPDNPITLQWSERKGSAWQNIASSLPNSGQYLWQLPQNLPDRVYLRLVVRDAAGNLGIAETPEPQLVDLSEPEGVILGIVNPSGQ